MARLTSIQTLPWLLILAASTALCPASTNQIAELTAKLELLRTQSRWTEGGPIADRLAELIAAHYGHDTTNTAEALQTSGWMAQNNGDLRKAERIWREALAIDEKLFGTNTIHSTRRLHMLGGIYRDQGAHEKAAPLFQRVLELREKHYGVDDPETGQIVNSIGRLKAVSGDYAGAVTYLSRALKIFENAGKWYRQPLAGTASALAWVYLAIGDRDQAESHIRRSLEIRKELHGWEHEGIVGSLREAAALYRAEEKLEKAESLLREALRIAEKLWGHDHVSCGSVLNDLGYTLLSSGELAEAEIMLARSLETMETAVGQEDHRLPSVLANLSSIHEKRGNYTRAREFANRAYEIRRDQLGDSHRYTIGSLQTVARVDALNGKPELALAQAPRIQEAEERLLANILSFTSERQRLDFGRYSQLFHQRFALWATINAPEPLARAILRSKALVLDSWLEDHRIAAASAEPDVRELLDKIREIKRGAAALDSRGETELESLEAALARRVNGLGRARRSLSVRVEEVCSALPTNTVLLEWLRYEHHTGHGEREEYYGVLLLSRNASPRWFRIGRAHEVERAVKLYQHAVRSPGAGEALTDSLRDLYRQLWSPLLSQLRDKTERVIVSPDGELNFISFATLLKPDGKFLGEQYLFSYVSCGRDLLAPLEQNKTGDLLVWANPDFGRAPAGAQNGFKLSPLDWAEREGRSLCSRAREFGFTNAVLHIGAGATERELFRINSPKALHLATHGFVLPQRPRELPQEESFDGFALQRVRVPTPNPMLHCGIALAGAQQTFQSWAENTPVSAETDGVVTATEIAALNLRGTWLVTVAACDSGGGQVRAGEGVLGLRRGFIQAGAQNLLLALWPVDDQHSGELIVDFYRQLLRTPRPAHALGRVQQKWLTKLRVERDTGAACRIAGPFILSFQGPPQ